ncbi:MAG: cytochrome b/b6 domain-containing protein [Pseudomonadales bacterium]
MTATAPTDHTSVAKLLHWAVAALVIGQFVLAQMAEAAAESERLQAQLLLLANHKSVGMSILILAIVRLLWRAGHPPPALPETMPRWQQRSATFAHWLLYALIFALPLSGWMLSSASAYSVSWFGLWQWPDLVSADPDLKEQLVNLHHLLAELLFIVALLHILAAFKHQFLDHDGVLTRMLSGAAMGLFAVLLVASVWGLGISATSARTVATTTDTATAAAIASAPTIKMSAPEQPALSAIPRWDIDYGRSEIRFIAKQAGADFEGTWQRWEADIQFDPKQLTVSRATVVIAADSANSADVERDSTLSSEEWFAATNHPQVIYRADHIAANSEQSQPATFRADGELQIKGLSVPVALFFNLTQEGGLLTLTGTATLDRIALNLGLGEWQDPDAVGHQVRVLVTVVATIPP